MITSLVIYQDVAIKTVLHNVWPAGHIRAATSSDVARDVQQEKQQFQSQNWH